MMRVMRVYNGVCLKVNEGRRSEGVERTVKPTHLQLAAHMLPPSPSGSVAADMPAPSRDSIAPWGGWRRGGGLGGGKTAGAGMWSVMCDV